MSTLRDWMLHISNADIEVRSYATNEILVQYYSDTRLNHFYIEEVWGMYQDEVVKSIRLTSDSPKIVIWLDTMMTVKASDEVERIDTS